MEEWVGQQWHRLITRAAQTEHPEAAVSLEQVQRTLGLLFRAGGGPGAAKLGAGTAQAVGGPRGWLQRVAGSGRQAHLAQREPERMNLPPRIAVFSERALNRALYLWLAALGAVWDEVARPSAGWVADNRAAARRVLQRFPGLAPSWQQLLRAQLALRPDPARLPAAEQASERALQAALAASLAGEETDAAGAWRALTPDRLAPVWVWLSPASGHEADAVASRDVAETTAPREDETPTVQDDTRRRARRTEDDSQRGGLMMFFRAESILSWGEYVKVHRATDDDPDPQAAKVADDFDTLSLAQGGERLASRVRFDLDLPSAAADDLPLGPGQTLPEWDWRQRRLLPDHCVVQTLAPRDPAPWSPPTALRATARRVRRHLERWQAAPGWRRGLPEGEALDLDAWVQHRSDHRASPTGTAEARVFARRERSERSLATLLLADLSQSTDAHVWPGAGQPAGPSQRVIDLIREALYVFGQALAPTGDAFEMLGFSSVRRQLRLHELKGFGQPWDAQALARVGALRPGYYTRMGAAIRCATQRLGERPERQRLLLLLTDGKPNDLDHYEGRHGVEDTREAVQAARAAGLTPFCVSMEDDSATPLPYLFGSQGYCRVRQPQQLVHRLAQIHAQLAQAR